MEIGIERLTRGDAKDLFAFECENRAFFEVMVPSRGEDYYDYGTFLRRHDDLLLEQEQEKSFFFLIKDDRGKILGRMNLVDINVSTGIGYIGYRVGEAFTGKGVADRALKLLLSEAKQCGVTEIHAKTTSNNIASQKVMSKNGFHITRINQVQDDKFFHYMWNSSLKK